ncbi:hypothetical protein SFRURICE_001406, partial [Spodoptera frugiperda]
MVPARFWLNSSTALFRIEATASFQRAYDVPTASCKHARRRTNSCNFHANLETKGKLDLLLRKFFHASLFSHTIRQSCNLCDRCWYRDIFDVHPLAWSSQIFYGRWGEERGVRLVIVRDTSRSPVVNGLDVTSPYLHVLMADATPVFILLCL